MVEHPSTPTADAALFDAERARRYDEGIRFVGLGYEFMHELSALLLGAALGEQAQLLIVGAGTGEEIVRLGAIHPGWTFTAVDPSGPMLAIAAHRLAAAGLTERVTLHRGLVADLPAAPAFDAATSLLVLHFLPDDGAKAEFAQAISTRLRPGAPLVLTDLVGEPASPEFALFQAAWQARQRLRGMSETDIEAMFRQLPIDVRFGSAARLAAVLDEAGFTRVTLFFQALLFGGWLAWTPPKRSAG